MRQEVQVYVTIKLKGLSQRFEESDEGDRQMGFGVVHCCYYDKIYLQLIDMGGLRLQRAIETDIQQWKQV